MENQIVKDAAEFALHYTPFRRAPQNRDEYAEAFKQGAMSVRHYFEDFLLAVEKKLKGSREKLSEFELGQLEAFYWLQDHMDGLFGE